MDWTLLFTCLLITFARVTDMTLDTVRLMAVMQGRRFLAAGLGFVASMVYLLAVSKVLRHFDHTIYAVAYAAGYAAGNFLGMTIERRIALGEQIISIFSKSGLVLASQMRALGHRVTEFQGRGRDGQVAALHIQTPRRQTAKVLSDACQLDPDCFYIVNDVRLAREARHAPARIFRIAA